MWGALEDEEGRNSPAHLPVDVACSLPAQPGYIIPFVIVFVEGEHSQRLSALRIIDMRKGEHRFHSWILGLTSTEFLDADVLFFVGRHL